VQLINFSQTAANQVAGPIKIVEIGASIAKSDAGNLFQFAALISINLAIINILPALDGGQLAFLLKDWGKPLPQNSRRCHANRTNGIVGFRHFPDCAHTANLEWVQKLFQ